MIFAAHPPIAAGVSGRFAADSAGRRRSGTQANRVRHQVYIATAASAGAYLSDPWHPLDWATVALLLTERGQRALAGAACALARRCGRLGIDRPQSGVPNHAVLGASPPCGTS